MLGDAGGIVGGIVGAKAFSNPIQETEINYCMNCGNRWNARELFELISVISHLLDAEVDLSIELHRYCFTEFVNTIIPEISRWENAKRERPSAIAASQKLTSPQQNILVSIGLTLWLIAGICLFFNQVLAVILFIVGCISGSQPPDLERFRKTKEREAIILAERNIDMAKQQLDDAIFAFVSKYTAYCLPY